jgi:hypothetical protein
VTYIAEFTTVATNADSAVLPPAIGGNEITVINSGAASLRVWADQNNPNNGNVADTLVNAAGSSANGYVDIAANGYNVFSSTAIGRWKSQQS